MFRKAIYFDEILEKIWGYPKKFHFFGQKSVFWAKIWNTPGAPQSIFLTTIEKIWGYPKYPSKYRYLWQNIKKIWGDPKNISFFSTIKKIIWRFTKIFFDISYILKKKSGKILGVPLKMSIFNKNQVKIMNALKLTIRRFCGSGGWWEWLKLWGIGSTRGQLPTKTHWFSRWEWEEEVGEGAEKEEESIKVMGSRSWLYRDHLPTIKKESTTPGLPKWSPTLVLPRPDDV